MGENSGSGDEILRFNETEPPEAEPMDQSAEFVPGSIETPTTADVDGSLVKPSESEPIPVNDPKEEEQNLFVDAEPPADELQAPEVVVAVAEGSESADDGDKVADEHDSPEKIEQVAAVEERTPVEQESRSLPVDLVDTDESARYSPNGDARTQDVGKEETFLDASDQLSAFDGRSPVVGAPARLNFEENLVIQEAECKKEVQRVVNELALLQESLAKTVCEKEVMEQEFKEEREILRREIMDLHRQLKVMTTPNSVLLNNGNELVNHLNEEDKGQSEDNMREYDTPLELMIRDCSKFVSPLKSALEEQVQSEGTIRELHAVLFMKDQDIEDLHAKVNELSVSNHVTVSYFQSLWRSRSQSLKESREGQVERDLYLEDITKRLLASLASVVPLDDLIDDSVSHRIALVEKGTSLVTEKHNMLLSEIDQLRKCLMEVRGNPPLQEAEFATVFNMARGELLEQKSRELELVQKLNQLEDENLKLLEQLDKEKKKVEVFDAEVKKAKMELEQEKIKSATAKEKLGLAVTKGKALVQQRDSLKQALTEKTNELEKCLLELQEKSHALEAAEVSNEELIKSQNFAASLQESLSEREIVLKEIKEIISQIDIPDSHHSLDITDCIRWLADERNVLQGVSLECQRLKASFSSLNLPETVASSEVESQINWLGESLSQAKDDIRKLQGEINSFQLAATSHESKLAEACENIEHLTASLMLEKQEKDSLRMGLEDLSSKYEAIVEREFQVSSEKDKVMRKLLETSGFELQSGVDQHYTDITLLIEKCVENIKEQIGASFEYSHAEMEQLERLQSLLYVKDQELVLAKEILEEELLRRTEMANMLNELKRVSQEVNALKDEKSSLQKDLELSDEKSALLREKLSMAVKKGKGLVQERENLRQALDGKNTEIEMLKLELQQQEHVLSDCRDEINRLSRDLEGMAKLESDLVAMKDQRDQIEKLLLESNGMLQRFTEAMDRVVPPEDTVFEEPVEKVKWLVECFHGCQVGKAFVEEELLRVKEEASFLASKLAEAHATIRSLEDELSDAQRSISIVAEEKTDIQVGKAFVEQELEKAKLEASSQASKFAEVCSAMKSLEDALAMAEKNISAFAVEKITIDFDKKVIEEELKKAKDEASHQASKLAEAYMLIKLLQEASSRMEENVSLLTDEKNGKIAIIASLEKELNELKDEAGSQASKLADAHATIRSLQDALSQVHDNMSVLVDEKKNVEKELLAVNAKLSASIAELAGSRGNIESQTLELFGHLDHLNMFLKDDVLLSSMTQGLKKKVESLRDLILLIEDIEEQFVKRGFEQLQVHSHLEKDSYMEKFLSACSDNFSNGVLEDSEANATDFHDISIYFSNIVEGFKRKNRILEDSFKNFSVSMDNLIGVLFSALQVARKEILNLLEHTESLKLEVKNMESSKNEKEGTISMLQDDINMLLSACTDATHELLGEADNQNLSLKLENWNGSLHLTAKEASEGTAEEQRETLKAAHNLLVAAKEASGQMKSLKNIESASLMTFADLQVKLKEAQLIAANAVEERDLYQNRISIMERDLEALQNFCSQMKLKLEDYRAKEDLLRDKDAEHSSGHHPLNTKEREADGNLLSEDQVKTLFEKINEIDILAEESDLGRAKLHGLAPVDKLFYIVDNFTELHHQLKKLWTCEKEELQSTLVAQAREIEILRSEVGNLIGNNQDSEKMRSDLNEVELDLDKIIQKLGGNDLVEDEKSSGLKQRLLALESLVMALILDCETSKSKALESVSKLHENQKVIGEFSAKIKFLEDSVHGRPLLPDSVQERGVFEPSSLATGSEISEIEDTGPLGSKSIPTVPSAAHVRAMRKGSSDHLALNIDSESDHLINHHETDDDKGHVFKSLNTSGLIPKQGRLIADRIDGIWVSGGRVLMSRPRARIGLVAYWLFLHIWLFATIL